MSVKVTISVITDTARVIKTKFVSYDLTLIPNMSNCQMIRIKRHNKDVTD